MKTANALKLMSDQAATPNETGPRLARGIVTEVRGAAVALALDDGREVLAELALALPYAACEGDVLLAIGEGERHYVIGVISGRGRTELAIEGDVALRAVDGRLDLSGDRGVTLRGPSIDVMAERITTIAKTAVETFATLLQKVSERLHVHAKEEVSIVDEAAYKQARSLAIQTEEVVTVQGKEIHLG